MYRDEENTDQYPTVSVDTRDARKSHHRLSFPPKAEGGDAPVDLRVNGGDVERWNSLANC